MSDEVYPTKWKWCQSRHTTELGAEFRCEELSEHAGGHHALQGAIQWAECLAQHPSLPEGSERFECEYLAGHEGPHGCPNSGVCDDWQRTDERRNGSGPIADMVNHPPHYTSHPSGIECITVTEWLGFNLGNAFKYVFRRSTKGDPKENLAKALWYLKRESGPTRAEAWLEEVPPGTFEMLRTSVREIARHEDRYVGVVLTCILEAAITGEPCHLADAIVYVKDLQR